MLRNIGVKTEFLVSCVLLNPTGSDGALTRTPQDNTLIPGRSLRLNCGTNAPPVMWSFTAVNSTGRVTMTSGGAVVSEFSHLFSIDSANQYDLVGTITNADQRYCGTYTCADNDGGVGADSATAMCSSECRNLGSYVKINLIMYGTVMM